MGAKTEGARSRQTAPLPLEPGAMVEAVPTEGAEGAVRQAWCLSEHTRVCMCERVHTRVCTVLSPAGTCVCLEGEKLKGS